jgi:mycofactocin glycosyltransferase
VLPLPPDFHLALDPATRADGRTLYGGEPYMRLRLDARQARTLAAWRAGEPVGEDGALARALTEHNLAQPLPPPSAAPVDIVIPVRPGQRPRFAGEAIVAPGSSPARARNRGLAQAATDVVACLDADVAPRPGWLDRLLRHFSDPEVQAVGARVATAPADRGPLPARVRPRGRTSFVAGAALLVRRGVRFDETLEGGDDVELSWRVHTRYEPAAVVDHDSIPLARRVAYGRHAAALARRHPQHAGTLDVSPWSAAAWAALALGRPRAALAMTLAATVALDDPQRARIAALGTLQAGRAIAEALTTHYAPLAPLAPKPFAAAALLRARHLPEDLAYSAGLWLGCLEQRDLRALKPRLGWTITRLSADDLIDRSSITLT